MARSFNGTSDWINASGTATGVLDITGNMTISAWANTWPANGAGTVHNLVGKGFDGSVEQYYFRFNATANPTTVNFGSFFSGTAKEVSWNGLNATHTSGTWAHFSAVYNGSYIIFSNGTFRAANAAAAPSHSTQTVTLGAAASSGTPIRFLSGGLAEVAIWNVALAGDEYVALSKGYSPLLIQPTFLQAYWPLLGRTSPEVETVGGFSGTVTGTTTIAHPRVLMPRPPMRQYQPHAALFKPAWATGNNLPVLGTGTF